MLSKNQVKLIQKLAQKKQRNLLKMFVVEGRKSLLEFVQAGYRPHLIVATEIFDARLENLPLVLTSPEELQKVSFLKNPDEGLGVFHFPELPPFSHQGLILALDNLQDPGNLGTLIRLCDWFGVEQLLCNTQTVDCYNPKVVQATMGSLTRVAVHYLPLADFLAHTPLPIYAMDLAGENLYHTSLPENAILLLGNEANGLSPEVKALAQHTVSIPRFGAYQQAESLNVAMAGAIGLSQARAPKK
ncbi:MAG: TrmH family RNA methyltransferase [Capnocytophaga sp.]|uniref:TrmH family RNA methyltransferase n=1 Tax=Capnocytophaga sp. TaxID=44737 RepID=UPI003FA02B9B